MKTLRLFGLALMATLLSVNLTSCSNDDEPSTNPEELIGEWYLIQDREWGIEDGEEYDETATYDINNPKGGDEKMVIEKTSNENEFSASYYSYNSYSNEWNPVAQEKIRIEGNKYTEIYEIGDEIYETDEYTWKIQNNKLLLYMQDKDEDGEYYYEATYQKK